MNKDPQMSARPCGCDPGANHQCAWHEDITARFEEAKKRMASRENAGMDEKLAADSTQCERPHRDNFMTADAPYAAANAAGKVGNGPQQGFVTGATRSSSDDKVDYEGHISPVVLRVFGEYMHEHRIQRDGRRRDSDNWQKGIPLPNYFKSLIRHTQEAWLMWRGHETINVDTGELFTFRTVLCAILFNVMGIIYEMAKASGGWMLERTYMVPADRLLFEAEAKQPTTPKVEPGVDALGHRHYKDRPEPCCKEPNLCGVGWCFLKVPNHPLNPNRKSEPRDEAALAPSAAEPETNKTFGQMIADANKVLLDKEREARIVEAQKRGQAMASGSGADCANPVIRTIDIDRATAEAFAGHHLRSGSYAVQLVGRHE